METLSPELTATLTVTSGLGILMASIARRKGMIEARDARKRCPSCGLVTAPGGSCTGTDRPR